MPTPCTTQQTFAQYSLPFSAQAAQRLPVGILFPMLFAIEEEARRITTTPVLPQGADCHDPLFTSALKAMIGLSPTKRWQTAELIRAYVGTLHEERHRTLVLDSLNKALAATEA